MTVFLSSLWNVMTPVFLVIVMMESLEAYYDVVSVGEACPLLGSLEVVVQQPQPAF